MLNVADLPAGMTIRPLRYAGPDLDPADRAAVLRVLHRDEERVLGAPDTTAAEVDEMVAAPQVLRAQSLLVLDHLREPVGAAWYDVDEGGREVYAEAIVDPRCAGAGELFGVLVRHSVWVARAVIDGRSGWKVRAGALESDDAATKVLRSEGFAHCRRFWRMEIGSDSPAIPATEPALPAGVRIDSGDSAEHLRAVYEVDQAAFADHWNFTPRSYEQIVEELRHEPGAQGEYWWLLRVEGSPAAICLLSDSRRERGYAYVSTLGVRREYRRRGLAQLLLRRTFVRARQEGLTGTALHVDAASPTGATRLYASVGMRAVHTFDVYELGTAPVG